jgi:hypothetical protein
LIREGLETYGSRDCCRRRRVRASRGVGFGTARGFEGLRFRIGCARRRMSRRGCGRVFGLPWFWRCFRGEGLSGDLTLIVAVNSLLCWRWVVGCLVD